MLGLFKAAAVLLAAPIVVATTRRPTTTQDLSHALIELDVSQAVQDAPVPETFVRLDVLESDVACGGYGNVTLGGQSLYQDENGFGSGPVVTEQGNVITADWQFTCVDGDNGAEQLIEFDVVYIDDVRVRDAGFSVQFRQLAPVQITRLNDVRYEAEYEAEVPESGSPGGGVEDHSITPSLEDELVMLEMMKLQLLQLEHDIAEKEQYLAETFDHFGASEEDHASLSHCDSFRCVVKTIYKDVKGMASKVYAQNHEHEMQPPTFGIEHGTTNPPLYGSPLDDEPSYELPDDSQGNPHDQFQDDDGELGVVMLDNHNDGKQHHITDATPDPPISTPSQEEPLHSLTRPDDTAYDNLLRTNAAIPILAAVIILGLVISILHTRCFASFRARRRARHHEKRAARRRCAVRAGLRSWAHGLRDTVRGSVHGWRERRRPPLQDEEKETDSARSSLVVSPPPATAGGPPPLRLPPLNIDPRWAVVEAAQAKSKPEPKARRPHVPSPSPPPRSRRSSSGDESDALTTTKEQELAQFRAVAGAVGDMVAAEESRRRATAVASMGDTRPEPLAIHPFHFGVYNAYAGARRHNEHSGHGHGHSAPPSPTSSSCPSYTSTDETLPPYDEVSGAEHHHSCPPVADGFRYAPTPLGHAPHYTFPRVPDERLGQSD